MPRTTWVARATHDRVEGADADAAPARGLRHAGRHDRGDGGLYRGRAGRIRLRLRLSARRLYRDDRADLFRRPSHLLLRRSVVLPRRQALGPLRPRTARALSAPHPGATAAPELRVLARQSPGAPLPGVVARQPPAPFGAGRRVARPSVNSARSENRTAPSGKRRPRARRIRHEPCAARAAAWYARCLSRPR